MLSAAYCDQLHRTHLLNITLAYYRGSQTFLYRNFSKYSQTCVQRPPLGPEKSDRWKEVPDKTEILTGRWCIKLAVVNRWPLFTGGR
jgi:hypothetical protein